MKKSISPSEINRIADLLEKAYQRLQSLSDVVFTTKAEEVSGTISQIEFDNWVRDFRIPDHKLMHDIIKQIGDLNHLPDAEPPTLKLDVTQNDIDRYKAWGRVEAMFRDVCPLLEPVTINSVQEWETALQTINRELNNEQ